MTLSLGKKRKPLMMVNRKVGTNTKTWRAARAVVLSRASKDRCHTNPDERHAIFPVVGPGHQRPVEEVGSMMRRGWATTPDANKERKA
jgi:hypothetical protein